MQRLQFSGRILIPLIVFALLLGCAGSSLKTSEGNPEILYQEGLIRFNKRLYLEAQKRFEELRSTFPDSPPYTLWAELKIGDCHFFKKEYVEAVAVYEEFKKVHPTHEEMPYVQYQIGMSHFNQMLSLDRDQTVTKKALSSFEYLVANFPPSLFTEKGREKIEICRKRLADHEFYIGKYYYTHERFEAASRRFEGLLEKFPKDPNEDETLFFLGKSYLELEEQEKAKKIFNRIITEYPQSSHSDQAKKVLERGLDEKKAETSNKKKKSKEEAANVISLIKFEEEKRKLVSLNSPLPAPRNPDRSGSAPKAEMRAPNPPNPTGESEKTKKVNSPNPGQEEDTLSLIKFEEEKRKSVSLNSPLPAPRNPDRSGSAPKAEMRAPNPPNPTGESEKTKKVNSPNPGQEKLVDAGEPVDITADRMETYSKENLIVFKGNVVARQRDLVIYADSIEAVTVREGKGIERVIATGNVKIQQGARVASSQKAVFNNPEQKLVLTGEPKVQEGDQMVSGDEIVFDIAENRVEVKGGAGGRGKVKIYPGGELEKWK